MLLRYSSLGILSVALSLFPASNIQAQSSSSYPTDYVEQYIENCSSGRGAQTEAICRCVIQEAQAQYTYTEFLQINQAIEETGNIPASLQIIINVCQQNIVKYYY